MLSYVFIVAQLKKKKKEGPHVSFGCLDITSYYCGNCLNTHERVAGPQIRKRKIEKQDWCCEKIWWSFVQNLREALRFFCIYKRILLGFMLSSIFHSRIP